MSYEIYDIFGGNPENREAWDALERLLKSQNTSIQFPHLAMAKVAYDKGEIVGYAVFQLIAHTDPLWVEPMHRGGELTHRLAVEISDFARKAAGEFVCVATSPFVDKLCNEQKMQVFPGTVYVGRA